jgi:hypothetical protein
LKDNYLQPITFTAPKITTTIKLRLVIKEILYHDVDSFKIDPFLDRPGAVKFFFCDFKHFRHWGKRDMFQNGTTQPVKISISLKFSVLF